MSVKTRETVPGTKWYYEDPSIGWIITGFYLGWVEVDLYLQLIFSQQPRALVEQAILCVHLGLFGRRRGRHSARSRGGRGGGRSRGRRGGELDGGVGPVHLKIEIENLNI